MTPDITAIILTFNEELHIARCLESIKGLAKEVYVVDSGSTDATCRIAREMGAKVVTYDWPGCQALQFNRALDNLEIITSWVMRLDADEYPTPELVAEIAQRLPQTPPDVNAYILPLGRVFMGRRLRHGIAQGVEMVRLFRRGKARYEDRLMDEHLTVEGNVGRLKHHFVDHSLIPLNEFIAKHNAYALREAATILTTQSGESVGNLAPQTAKKRRAKSLYARMPMLWRAFGYFFYRYVVRLGFLDGREGFLWDFLQGWWYRTLVDARIIEIKRQAGSDDPAEISRVLRQHYGINLPTNPSSQEF
ncbi:MAG: glycosyltransferase family 2 protein [Muribaculaceae bacterium]|nr:glycosyltransferase family 2 protein [Muribaculaceae bacterium]